MNRDKCITAYLTTFNDFIKYINFMNINCIFPFLVALMIL